MSSHIARSSQIRRQRDRKLDSKSFASAISNKSKQSQSSASHFSLQDDYTSAYSYNNPEQTPEPISHHSTRRRGRKGGSSCLLNGLFYAFVGLSLAVFWVSNHSHLMQRHAAALNSQQQSVIPQMLSDFVISASSASSADAFLYGNNNSTQLLEPAKLDENPSLVQEGAPEAKFAPASPNQQLDRLFRGQLQVQQEASALSSASSETNFKPSPFAPSMLSDSLEQCTTYVTNPNSVKELIYWEEHIKDYAETSSWFRPDARYITFEPDTGGFAAQRLVLEQVVQLAFAMGRTLVLPPRRGMRDGTLMNYNDYFPMLLDHKYKGLHIIGMPEFLQYVANPGHLHSADNVHTPLFPPNQRTNWDSAADISLLYNYLRTVGTVPHDWNPQDCIVGYRQPSLQKMLQRILRRLDGRTPPTPLDFQGKPTPVNAPEYERLREFLADRKRVCSHLYESDAVVHIPTTETGKSLLHAPFYSFFFYDSWQQDLIAKRMMRDVVRYNDVIVCAAARIIDWLRLKGTYDAIHIRGPSYQDDLHSDVNTNPAWILHDVSKYIPKGSVLYIATDYSGDPTWFDPLREQYQLYFASDFKGVFDSLLPWYLEMVEQLICARSRTFVGTYYSPFSSYTMRLRGYYSQRDEWEGYKEGALPNTYYASPVAVKGDMVLYKALRQPLAMREFPVAWRDINHGATTTTMAVSDNHGAAKNKQIPIDQKRPLLPQKWT